MQMEVRYKVRSRAPTVHTPSSQRRMLNCSPTDLIPPLSLTRLEIARNVIRELVAEPQKRMGGLG